MFSIRSGRLSVASLAASVMLAFPFVAAAQSQATADTPAKPDNATKLATVKVEGQSLQGYTVSDTAAATRLPLTLQDTPQSVSVITAQRMEDQNLTNVRAVLDNTTGVSSNAYDSERVLFYSRGFQIENMAYDGVPVAPSLNSSSADGSLDTSIYDRIEVVRGATGLMSGAGSPSALINFVRKHADSRTFNADATISYGTWGTTRETVDIATPITASGSVRGRVVATHEEGGSYIDRYSSNKNVLYAVVDADLGPNTTLSAGLDYQKTKPNGVTWGTYPVFYDDGGFITWPRGFSSAASWSFWYNTTKTAFVDLKHEFANGWQLHALASRRETDGDMALFYVYGFPNRETGEGAAPYAYRGTDRGRQNMADIYLSGPFEAFGREHELVAGLSGSRYTQDSYENAHGDLPDTGNFLQWTGNYPYPEFAPTGDLLSAARIKQGGAYVASRWSLADNIKLIAGARYSTWTNDTFDASAGTYHHEHSKTIPYAGLIYDITPVYSAFASYTQIFDPQNNRRANGDFLDPVIGSSREVGIKGRHFDGRLNTSLTFFDTRQDNVAQADPGQFLPDGITQAYTPVNGTRSRGYEFEASGAITDRWNTTLGWSHFNIKAPQQGAINTSLPRTLVRLFTTYQLPGSWNGLTIGGGPNWQSASQAPVDGPNGTQYVNQSSVLLLSAMARYAFNDHVSLQVNGENLLDRKYFVLDEYSNLYYAAGRSATLSFNYKFF
ncbi:TonB-dependent siderophore receptor [Pinirhizobacter soli]|uniref:TonB-dependent siderophore receptor n=1 Tax=Pinirhizobacter soli TaxID=2786953 RepID=UPI00202A0452|nr:TonB-dependent siderophore receptor [Pinirhizobacter soli]